LSVESSQAFTLVLGLVLLRFEIGRVLVLLHSIETALVSKSIGFALLRFTIGLRNSHHFFIRSKVKPKPIVTRSHSDTFSRASRQLHVFTTSFDWFTGLSVSFAIGYAL